MDAIAAQVGGTLRAGALHRRDLRFRLYLLLFVADCVAIGFGCTVGNLTRGGGWLSLGGISLLYPILPIYLLIAFNNKAYSWAGITSRVETLRRSLVPLGITGFALLTLIFFVKAGSDISRLALLVSFAAAACAVLLLRLAIVEVVRRTVAPALVAELLIVADTTREDWCETIPCDTIFAAKAGIEPDLDNPYMLHRFGLIVSRYERVVVRCPIDRQADWARLLRGANVDGEILSPGFGSLGVLGLQSFKGRQTLLVARGPLSNTDMAQKRALDLAVTLPVLVLLAPLLLVAALAIKLDSPGPVLFRQERIGRANRLFRILKFRSMWMEASDGAGTASTQRDDARITRVGRLLRRTSLDELPQLLNVLRGDMSLVGPRPHALGSLAGDQLFWEVDRDYWHRHALKPGITGLAQIRGFRGATLRDEDLRNRLRADLEYLHGWHLMRDVRILIGTLRVLVHRNAY